jgi:hypothetical protein
MVPLIVQHMSSREALFLEEPPTEEFSKMLKRQITIEDYLFESDVEYPVFSASMCSALRGLNDKGKQIFQVEPYLENLIKLHSIFAEGIKPEELDDNTITHLVYLMEKKATGALLDYYQAATSAPFDLIVKAVKRFARADAERFRLRDSLRSQALSHYCPKFRSSFIEAGLMHFSLRQCLRQSVPKDMKVQSIFVADEILRHTDYKKHLYSPGDQLTLLYIFKPEYSDGDHESILAARSLIYSKIIHKEEMNTSTVTYPHIHDELLCIDVTRRLSVGDCRLLFDQIRRARTIDSRQIVADYLTWLNPEASQNLKIWSTNPSKHEVFDEQLTHPL